GTLQEYSDLMPSLKANWILHSYSPTLSARSGIGKSKIKMIAHHAATVRPPHWRLWQVRHNTDNLERLISFHFGCHS
ncbi:MAG: hypothetical protein WCB09_09745, partial [Methylocella sp.]